MKYSQEQANDILDQILFEMKNYDKENIVKPNVIFIIKELYEALKLYNLFPSAITPNKKEYLFGMEVRVCCNLANKLFILHDEIKETFFDRIRICKSPKEMQELLSEYLLGNFYSKNQILEWLNSEFK